jgi:hypothetical protein
VTAKTIDFTAIKEAVSVEAAAGFLALKLTKHGEQYRSECPQCQQGGDRAIVITPAKNAWYCFALKKGGDCIALVAHIRSIGQRDAAVLLQEQFIELRAREAEPDKPRASKRSQRKAAKSRTPSKSSKEAECEYSIVDWLGLS